jgi:hypothetical protein
MGGSRTVRGAGDAAEEQMMLELDVFVGDDEPVSPGHVEVEVRVGEEPVPPGMVEVELLLGSEPHEAVKETVEQCEDCKGIGVYVGLMERRPCPTCDGRGEIVRRD